ncbi:hypothetical protein D8B26_003238 [Coccidioides posadasii str. Silveira]|uniref:Uncharacterized protein n=1 Tax=Coccidioides posadasii (strain RMSCC 757 / Silveira) TaxID=443226 RepID=E9D0B6_COCPS|nr:conserved hypothetical protein [Coccidioides posadasii str. Silveira]QVM08552.1 hypothetical protein D8B26_003238 [Coccidioides posadasii str. Silveira]
MFTDHLDKKEPCVWNAEKNSCEHCLDRATRKCRDVHESATNLVRKLLRLREKYLDLTATDSHQVILAREMCGLVRDYHGLDSGVAKHQKGSAKKMYTSHCHALSPVAGPSTKHHHYSTPSPGNILKISSNAVPNDAAQEPLHFLTPICAGMSQIHVEVGNVQVSINQLAARLASGTKELHGTAETGFANIVSTIDGLTDAVTSGFQSVVDVLRTSHCPSGSAPAVLPSSVATPSAAVPSVMVPSVVVPPVPAFISTEQQTIALKTGASSSYSMTLIQTVVSVKSSSHKSSAVKNLNENKNTNDKNAEKNNANKNNINNKNINNKNANKKNDEKSAENKNTKKADANITSDITPTRANPQSRTERQNPRRTTERRARSEGFQNWLFGWSDL